jgi:trehalose-phosphatase
MTEVGLGGAPSDSVLRDLASTPRLLVCCDFDGTISTLADEPAAARPVDGAVAVLDYLASLPETWTTIVSGRSLIDLTQLADVSDRVRLVGSHGAEFEVGAILAFGPTEASLLEVVIEQCHDIVAGSAGVLVETKPASVAVHVRRAAPPVAARVLDDVRTGPGSLEGVHTIEGKDVVELAVMSSGKGDAIDVLRSRWSVTATLFVGDDVTDESAFAALGPGDVGIKVGEGPTGAAWRLPDPASVVALLRRLVELREE